MHAYDFDEIFGAKIMVIGVLLFPYYVPILWHTYVT